MARYVYFCATCKQKFEIDKPMVRSSQAETCPQCGATGERIFTAPGITIKGATIKFKDGESLSASSGCENCCNDRCYLK